MSDSVSFSHKFSTAHLSRNVGRNNRLFDSFVRGLASLIVFNERAIRISNSKKADYSDMDVLRGDFERIGADMWRVFEHEKVDEKIEERKKSQV